MKKHTLGIDIGSTTVKIAILDENDKLVFSDYERHFANIQESSGSTFRPGGYRCVHFPSEAGTKDRRSHRVGW